MLPDGPLQTLGQFRRGSRAEEQRLHPHRTPCRIRRNRVGRQPAQIDNECYLGHDGPPNSLVLCNFRAETDSQSARMPQPGRTTGDISVSVLVQASVATAG